MMQPCCNTAAENLSIKKCVSSFEEVILTHFYVFEREKRHRLPGEKQAGEENPDPGSLLPFEIEISRNMPNVEEGKPAVAQLSCL